MRLLLIPILFGLASLAALAQGGPPPRPPGDILERLSRLTPAERRAVLGRLPAERRRLLEDRLERWENLPPEERRRLSGSYARFRELTPEDQGRMRELVREFQRVVPPRRRPAAQRAIRMLRDAGPEQRRALVASPRYQAMFSEAERSVIEQMAAELPVGPPPRRPRRPER